jgi:hypothetical protein
VPDANEVVTGRSASASSTSTRDISGLLDISLPLPQSLKKTMSRERPAELSPGGLPKAEDLYGGARRAIVKTKSQPKVNNTVKGNPARTKRVPVLPPITASPASTRVRKPLQPKPTNSSLRTKPSADTYTRRSDGYMLAELSGMGIKNKGKENSVNQRVREWEREKERLREMSRLEELERERDELLEQEAKDAETAAIVAETLNQVKEKIEKGKGKSSAEKEEKKAEEFNYPPPRDPFAGRLPKETLVITPPELQSPPGIPVSENKLRC